MMFVGLVQEQERVDKSALRSHRIIRPRLEIDHVLVVEIRKQDHEHAPFLRSRLASIRCRCGRWISRRIRLEQIKEGIEAMKAGEVIRSIIDFEAETST